MPRIFGKYAGIIKKNNLRISFILGIVSQLCWKGENNPFTIPGTDTVQFCVYTVFTSFLHSHRVSFTHTHTHAQNHHNNNKAVSTISFQAG
jgi:amino acid permease